MPAASSPLPFPGFERSLAVVIGINAYSHGVPPLHNAVRDASAMADTLERQSFEVMRFLDSQASLSALSELVCHYLPALQPAPDRLLIYFAGHGLAHTDERHQLSGFLLPADARRDDSSSYWPMASIHDALSRLPCRHLLLILDCCFAGAFPHATSRDLRPPQTHAPLFLERFRHFSSRRSFQLLVSTSHDERASDRLLSKPSQEALGSGLHSPFACALLEALAPASPADFNRDGLLTASELYTFLRDRLVSLLPSHSQQTPTLRHLDGHDGGEFLFLLSKSFPPLPSAAPISKHSNPYLGLRPFSPEHRHLFFGRERIVDDLIQRLHSQPLLVLCGPSGAGKSSLVQAGLLPRLSEQDTWRIPPALRPSSEPFQQLSAWLATLSPESSAPTPEALASQPRLAADFLLASLTRNPDRTFLLVVDPLEELVTACLDDSLRVTFLRALASLLQLSHPRLRLLVLLRTDFEPHFVSLISSSTLPLELWRDNRFLLPPMNREDLRRCIQKPAEACVLFFASGLVERLLDDVEQMPGALPLLSVALSELFDAYLDSGREDRNFSFEDYQRLGGGIAGALQRRAELIYSGAPPASGDGQPPLLPIASEHLPAFQATLRNVLLRMISPEGRELARRRVPRAELDYPHPEENARVQHVLAALEAGRLVVAGDNGGPCVEPAHDALLSAWPRLHDWARQAQRELLLLRRISHAASEWHRNPSSTFLWADARLDSLELPASSLRSAEISVSLALAGPTSEPSKPLILNSIESAFLRASARHRLSLRTRRNRLALTVAACLVILTGLAFCQADKANRSAREAHQQKELADINAREALKQQHAAEANAEEARRQRQAADVSAKEAQLQQHAAEASAKEARRQRQAADASAKEAQRQQRTAEFNLMEALRQKQAADTNGREAQTQKNMVLAHTRILQAQRLLEVDPTKALLVLLAMRDHPEELPAAWLQLAIDTSQRPLSSAILTGHDSELLYAVFSPDGSRVLTASWDGTTLIWHSDGRGTPLVLQKHSDRATYATFSPDGSHVLTISWDDTARIWRSDGHGSPIILQGDSDRVTSATFSPDGSRVLTASEDGTARIWRSNGQGAPIVLKGHSRRLTSATFSPDGSRVLTASEDGTARIWRSDGHGAPIVLLKQSDPLTSATFSPDGSRVLTASEDGTARIWRSDGQGSPLVLQGHSGAVHSATFSPDGSCVLTTSWGTARIWRSDGQGSPLVLLKQSDPLTSATFSPDGSHVLTLSQDGTARIWRSDGHGSSLVLQGHSGLVTSATFSPDGSRVLTASKDGTARIWRSDGYGSPLPLQGFSPWIISASFSPDGSHVLTTSPFDTFGIWRSDGQGAPLVLEGLSPRVRSATFSPDGSHVLAASEDGTARIWRSDGQGAPLVLRGHSRRLTSATFSPDGSRVLTASEDGTARIWPSDGHGAPIVFRGHSRALSSATCSPDGSRVLTASEDGTARIWPSDGHGAPIVLQGHSGPVRSATFSPDGSHVLTISSFATVSIWPSDGHGAPIVLQGHSGPVLSATFSPDGSRVLTASDDGTARIWPSDGRGVPLILEGLPPQAPSATFSPNGAHVLTASEDGTARIWPSDGHGAPIVLEGHSGPVISVTFSPDGSHVLTVSEDGTARIWPSDGHGAPIVLRGYLRPLTSATFSPDGSRVVLSDTDEEFHIVVIAPIPLVNALQQATTACLSPAERERYLLESESEALEGLSRCMRARSRAP